MKIVIHGEPITKKNSMRIVRAGDRMMVIPSAQYKAYEADAIQQIPSIFRLRLDSPCNVQCVYYMRTKRRVDLVNLLEATCDILVRAEVLEDDHCRIVARHDGSRVECDKDDPRVEIDIQPITG